VRGVYVARLDGSESRRLADADAAAVFASGHLLFVRQSELLAQPFDADRLTLGGPAVRVAGPVAVNPAISLASLAASPGGASRTRPAMSTADSSCESIERARKSRRSGSRSTPPDGVPKGNRAYLETGLSHHSRGRLNLCRGQSRRLRSR
jgi:hypothetical protein